MIRTSALPGVLLGALFAASVAAAAGRADQLLAASEKAKNPEGPFSLKVTMVEYRGGAEEEAGAVAVYSKPDAKGQYRSLVRFLSPDRDRGKLLLRIGEALWFYDPGAARTVRVPPQQRVTGPASNADLVGLDLRGDYRAVLEKEETIQDAEKRPRACYRLGLTALYEAVSYPAVEYWLDQENLQPVKAKFYSETERLLKTVYYKAYEAQLGKVLPTQVLILDGADPRSITRMTFSDFRARDLPEEWFRKEHLPKFKPE